jgi:ABC-type Co2+ transport system permease subunit
MEQLWQDFITWFMSLGEPYGVNPIIFGSIYIGAVPFFWVALAWLVRNLRTKKSVAGPVIMACACASSSYVYLIVAGQNVPVWVYVIIAVLIGYAVWSTLRTVRRKKEALRAEAIR